MIPVATIVWYHRTEVEFCAIDPSFQNFGFVSNMSKLKKMVPESKIGFDRSLIRIINICTYCTL